MDRPLNLIFLEEWKRRTRVLVARKKPFQIMTPLVSKEEYDAERDRAGRDGAGRACPSVTRIIWRNVALPSSRA